jgi:SAM-dependent methyltransferase
MTLGRFAREAERLAALQDAAAPVLAARVRSFLAPLTGDERALDAGCGAGALALALAPLVREVVGLDAVPEALDQARRRAPANATFVEGELARLPFERGAFDLAGCLRVLHHVPRPELAVSELVRVTRPGGRIVVVDQLGTTDPLVQLERDRFERTRDPSHQRSLPDADIRALLEMNDLVVLRDEVVTEERELDAFLDRAGLDGEERARAAAFAPGPSWRVEVGWYLARKPGG